MKMTSAQNQRFPSFSTTISALGIVLYCTGFLRVELELYNQKKRLDALEIVAKTKQPFSEPHHSIVKFIKDAHDFFPNEHHRSKRHAKSANNTTEAKTTAVLIKEIHNILSEGRIRLCKSTNESCQSGPPGPRGEKGDRGRKGKRGSRGSKGYRGIMGSQGKSGPVGPKGDAGLKGQKGETGIAGVPGAKGDRGTAGPPGKSGKQGIVGPVGPEGVPGLKGRKGDKGIAGMPGAKGDRGTAGPPGKSGKQGIMGPVGPKGVPGFKGRKGDKGIAGMSGAKGDRGMIGSPGKSGKQGIMGPAGPKGVPGLKGRKGDKGIAGMPGAKGERGMIGSPGKIGKQGIIGPVGPKGVPGLKGQKGDTGSAGMPGAKGEPGQLNPDCLSLLKSGHTQSRVYSVDPDGKGSFQVYCDMQTDGGGWTVFQRRQDGSVDFYRGWNDYKSGFGQLTAEFWLGNDKIHRLTAAKPSTLRVELEDWNGNRKYAKYGKFNVGDEQTNYRLEVGSYSGTAGDSLLTGSHGIVNNMAFSTKDRDNDLCNCNCAVTYTGAWWYRDCHHCNLNGKYLGNTNGDDKGIIWYYDFRVISLKFTEMKLRPSS